MDNKHYIITGGTSGLGYSIVKALLNKGCKVTILSRDLYKFNQIELFKNNKNVQVIECDLLNIEDLTLLESKLSNDIDGFIHCAGLSYIVNMSSISIEQMNEIYKINTINFSILLNVLRKFFVEEPTIVGISSFASLITDKGTGHYGASKAAFSQILNTLRMEEPKYHVLVVNPGPIDTPFLKKADLHGLYKNMNKTFILNPDKLAETIVKGIQKQKEEINKPQLVHYLLKIYQISPLYLKKKLHKYLA